MNTSQIEKQAESAALAQVAAMFHRPEQLEKLETMRKRAVRKKVSCELIIQLPL